MAKLEETKPDPKSKPSQHPHAHLSPAELAHQVGVVTHRVERKLHEWIARILAALGISAVGTCLLLLMGVLLVLRFYGLPPQAKKYLLHELEQRGVAVSIDRLLLDPSGDFIADQVSVFRTPSRQDLVLQVDQVRIGVAWFSWWRGQPFLQDAAVHNATIHLPITDQSTVSLTQVSAAVRFTPTGLIVQSAQARVLNLLVDVRGAVLINGPLPKRSVAIDPDLARANAARIDALWQKIVAVSDDFDTQHPAHLQLDFNLATATPEAARVQALLSAHYFRWRGALIDEINVEASLADQVATLSQFHIQLARGELNLNGEADLTKHQGHLDFYSDLDFTPLAVALPGRFNEALSRFVFTDLPVLSGRLEGDWSMPEKPTVNLQADLDWENFSYGGATFTRLLIPLAFDGNRIFIPEADLVADNGKGALKIDMLYDRSKPEIRARIDSTLDVTVFDGLISPGVDRFLESLHFNSAGPVASLTVLGTTSDPRQWLIQGHGRITDCTYKHIAIDSAEADLAFQDSALDVKNLIVHRKEGAITGGLRDDFGNRSVRLDGLRTSVNIQEVAPALGAKFTSYVAPYQFDRPPNLKVNGLVDLNDQKPHLDTDLTIAVDSDSTLHYVIEKIPLPIERPKAQIHIVDRTLTLHCDDAQLFDGKLGGNLKVLMDAQQPTLDASLQITGGDFRKAMIDVYKSDKSSGSFNLQMAFTGGLGDLSSLKGNGSMLVDNGYLMSIPVLGDLSVLIDAVIPGFVGKADHGKCTFKIIDGSLHTDDLTISSALLTLIGSGQADFVHNALDFDMRVNVKGLPGLFVFPISKLFEYHGSGPLENPVWKPKAI